MNLDETTVNDGAITALCNSAIKSFGVIACLSNTHEHLLLLLLLLFFLCSSILLVYIFLQVDCLNSSVFFCFCFWFCLHRIIVPFAGILAIGKVWKEWAGIFHLRVNELRLAIARGIDGLMGVDKLI